MDVLHRCRAYEKDMGRLRLRLACARDAAMRTTRSAEIFGHGAGWDRMGDYAAKADAIEREIRARTAQYLADVGTAARLVAALDPLQGSAMHLRYVRGLTVRQTAAELHVSCDSVRGLCRRGREALDGILL